MKHFSTFGALKFTWIKFIIYCYSHNPFAATLCSHFRFHYSSHFALSIFRSSWCFKHTLCAHSVAVVNRETQWLIETPHVVWGLQMFETENDFQYNSSDSTQKKKQRHKRHEDLLIHMNGNQFDIGYLVKCFLWRVISKSFVFVSLNTFVVDDDSLVSFFSREMEWKGWRLQLFPKTKETANLMKDKIQFDSKYNFDLPINHYMFFLPSQKKTLPKSPFWI